MNLVNHMKKHNFLIFAVFLLCTVLPPPLLKQAQAQAEKSPPSSTSAPSPPAGQESPPAETPQCSLGALDAKPIRMNLNLDDKRQMVTLTTRYGFDSHTTKKGKNLVVTTEVSSVVFDDFLKTYHNFLMKRVGPASRCDKLELGKLQVRTEKNGKANGFFVGRYVDRSCLYLRFFDSRPGDFDRDMFVLYSAKGITGAKNIFTPAYKYDKEFYIHVETIYEPIEEPSVFGRGGATLSGLYKERLENFLGDPDMKKIYDTILPEKGKETNKYGFKPVYAGFMTNSQKRIQLTFMLQRAMSAKQACTFRESLIKNGYKPSE